MKNLDSFAEDTRLKWWPTPTGTVGEDGEQGQHHTEQSVSDIPAANRKDANQEEPYEKMLKLRRDLSRAVTLLEMIKRHENLKREQLHLSIEVYEKRYQAQDFAGQMLAEFASNSTKASRPAFAPVYSNKYSSHHKAMAGCHWVRCGCIRR
ncbi:enhancer of polycomb [Culex quinquefasciatus]|uniref:Enhancer of polycomb n=1 Tax=Culex quinquefasciatus TaxID=7176 RepID=B0W6T6_CULQU|nr:enhancer of polycomb homolog 1 [Culex quinquefasciatus]EDS36917.1 enhancer of polycomb [Culex quinquefasciatus]EDS40885.1 enhancer of polycomb [Culex quinquefasciatus]|eukprot:XP_001844420.1 enhancer of polycomb [Culex quinquefasciatus]